MPVGTKPRCCGTSARHRRWALPYDQCRWRQLATLSGGEQKRLVLEALLRGLDEVLLLDEPDNFLDVPAKRWLEERLVETPKTVLFVSHDRELLARTATRVVTLELGAAGNTAWVHGGGFETYHDARRERFARLGGVAPPLGRGARKAQGPRADVQAEGRLQRRDGLAIPGGRRPGCASSRRPARRRPSHGNRTSGCGCVVGAPGSARWYASGWS